MPQALSGYRPRVAVTASAGYQYTDIADPGWHLDVLVRTGIHGANAPRSVGATVTQTLFNGQQTANRTRAAESQVSGAREGLRVLEQTVLLAAATIYMDYLRDSAIVEVQRSNVRVLEQTLKQTRDRFNVGEVTRTDVAQSEAQLAAGRTQLLTAESNLTTTRSQLPPHHRQRAGRSLRRVRRSIAFCRRTLPAAVELGLIENPNVTAAMFGIDVSFLQVKVNEGALLPTVTLQAAVQQSYEQSLIQYRSFGASAIAQLNVPIYQGGAEYALIRQSKETLAQQRLDARTDARPDPRQRGHGLGPAASPARRRCVRAGAGAGLRDRAERRARGSPGRAAHHARRAERAAGAGQRARRAGDRAARPRGRVLLRAGRGRPAVADGAATWRPTVYDPSVHYHQVRDSWAGVRTPDGR